MFEYEILVDSYSFDSIVLYRVNQDRQVKKVQRAEKDHKVRLVLQVALVFKGIQGLR